MTALQPPPPSATHSVNPDLSAFGTATLHAENRTTYHPRGDVQTDATAVDIGACGQEIFYSRGPELCGKCRDGFQRVGCRSGINQYALPHQLVSSHSKSTNCCISTTTHHYGFDSPVNSACALYPLGSDSPERDHAPHPVLNHICISHNTTVQTGRHPSELRLR